jgi:hypothetical protein
MTDILNGINGKKNIYPLIRESGDRHETGDGEIWKNQE